MQEAKTKKLAEVLNEARKARGYTYTEVAKLVGVSYPLIWDAMNGTRLPREPELRRLALTLGLDGDELAKKRHSEFTRSDKGKHHKREFREKYTVYNNYTDELVIIDGVAEECAAAMRITVGSFYCAITRMRNSKKYAKYRKDEKWTILRKGEI